MSVGALEHKMGIHAQPTCVMNYDGATGWLVGEPGRGLNAMFTMMNAERLMVGVQGLGIAEAANQKAVAYARERLQGNGPDGTPGSGSDHRASRRAQDAADRPRLRRGGPGARGLDGAADGHRRPASGRRHPP